MTKSENEKDIDQIKQKIVKLDQKIIKITKEMKEKQIRKDILKEKIATINRIIEQNKKVMKILKKRIEEIETTCLN